MDSGKAWVAERFARDLRELRLRAGRPSYSTLERVSKHELRRATMSDILNGNRVNLPDWRFVAIFVEACHTVAAESNLDTHDLGALADWKGHWDSASNGFIGARFPGGGQLLSAGPESADRGQVSSPRPDDDDQDAERAGAGAARPPVIWGWVPPRLTDFVGRDGWLARLRRLLTASQANPVAIQGLYGTGKTQLAVEYAYRYARAYDLIWWVPCDDAITVHRAMADLGARLGLPDTEPGTDGGGPGVLYDRLRQGRPPPRWLLVFDNADEPDEIRHLVRPMGGHVLITSRNSRWEAIGDMLELEPFSRDESLEFLQRRMPRYNTAEAHRIAETVGDLPLFLEHAVEAPAPTGQYLARLESDPLGLLGTQPSDYPASLAAQWSRTRDLLGKQAPDALELLSCLCFFGTGPIPREALERGRYLTNVSVHSLLSDPMRPDLAIMMLRRAGLLRVDAGTRTLMVHQVVRYIVRHMVTRAGAGSAERSRRDAQLLLAAADPLNPEDPANWRSYEQLREHAAAADVEGCPDQAARRLVINLVRFLNASGDPHGALGLADSALSRWAFDDGQAPEQAAPPGIVPEGNLAMRQARVDALFACGRYQEALESQQDTLSHMRSAPGDWDDEITLLGALDGGRSRMAGRFAAALTADLTSRARHRTRFGRDHPHSFAAATAVIIDLALTGQFAEALAEARQVYEDCRAFHNDDSYPAVLFQRNLLARCMWLHGQAGEAARVMTDVHAGYQALADGGVLAETHPWRLAHEVDSAVIRRDSGGSAADLVTLEADLNDARRRSWRTLGADHPQTLAATVALASILRRTGGREGEAVRLLADAGRRYQTTLPDHPFAHACRGYLAVVRQQTTIGSSLETAADLDEVTARLTDLVGDDHPLTRAARTALASMRAADSEFIAIDFTPLPL